MNKYVVGSILAVISLLVIYGASASNRVIDWVDNSEGTAEPSEETNLVSLNSTRTRGQSAQRTVAQVNEAELDPLEKAGQLPQRQTFTDTGTRTEVTTSPTTTPTTASTPSETTTTTTTSQTQTTTTTPQPTTTVTNPPPVRALW